MRARVFILMAMLLSLGAVESAAAALSWRPEQTVDVVRGMPRPDVAVSDDGRAALVFSRTDFRGKPQLEVWVRRAGAPEPFIPGAVAPPGGATDPRIAMSPAGVTAIAALEAGKVFVTMYPASPQDRYRGKVVEIDAPGFADEPRIGIDAEGRATVVWASPPRVSFGERPRQVYAVTVGPNAVAGPVQALGEPGNCDPALDVNLRGDAAVALNCPDRGDLVFHRPAGGSFGPGEAAFAGRGTVQVGIDGNGTVHALETAADVSGKHSEIVSYRLAYATRAAGGIFSPPDAISRPGGDVVAPPDLEVQESGRAIVGWLDGEGRFVYAVRASGASFGPSATAGVAGMATRDDDLSHGPDVVASPHGPVLLAWGEGGTASSARVAAAMLEPDGRLTSLFRGVRGPFPFPSSSPAFAVNDAGRVVGAWEQQCSYPDGALAVMAVQRDVGGAPKGPPCQDRRPPRTIAVRKRASLAGRVLRARVACDEVCHLTASARVLRAGKRKPIATARTGRERRLAERRGTWLRLRLSAPEVRRIVRARRADRKVTVRLSVSVRDAYGNGRRWRLKLPVRG